VRIGRERVRVILHQHDISFQRTRTWKTSTDPAYDAKLDRIDEVVSRFPDRVFAFDQFGPLSIRPCHGTCWAARKHPDRLRATYHRTHGIRYLLGSDRGALPRSLSVGFPDPPAEPGVLISQYRALHVS
jgi:hypothetical protein